MITSAIQLLPATKARQMKELAERAQLSLARFAETDVAYNAIGIQLLDEWIDRHLRQFPNPSPSVLTVWAAFLGEAFRQRFHGEWAIDNATGKPRLGILTPKSHHDFIFIDIMDQVERRVKVGIAESLSFYYATKGIEIKQEIE